MDYDLNYHQSPILCGNISAINLTTTKNPIMHSKTKHIQICHHFIKDHVQKDDISLRFIQTNLPTFLQNLLMRNGLFLFVKNWVCWIPLKMISNKDILMFFMLIFI